MSLINDMLKDLDRRSQPVSTHAAALRGLGLAGMHVHGPRGGRTIALGGAALLVTAMLAGIAVNNTVHLPAQAPGIQHEEKVIIQALRLPEITANRAAAADPVTPATGASASLEGTPATVRSSGSNQPHTRAEGTAITQPALPVEEMVDEDAGHIKVTPRPLSAEQQLARDFQAAAAALNNGDPAEAERLLEELLGRDSGLHKARLLLASLYVQQQRNSRAESVLSSGLLHYPQHAPYARLYAQLLAAEARDSEAINVLQAALPAAGDDAGYHALLAGLYQRSGNPGAASASYRKALQLAPSRGEWWMGLGISSEQGGDAEMAITAYRQALQQPLNTTLQQYVQQRLAQLTQ